MKFTVAPRYLKRNLPEGCYLTWDNWNDYSFYTLFGLVYVDAHGQHHYIGAVKIVYENMPTGPHPLSQGQEFNHLPQNYFSLGTDANYYHP